MFYVIVNMSRYKTCLQAVFVCMFRVFIDQISANAYFLGDRNVLKWR